MEDTVQEPALQQGAAGKAVLGGPFPATQVLDSVAGPGGDGPAPRGQVARHRDPGPLGGGEGRPAGQG